MIQFNEIPKPNIGLSNRTRGSNLFTLLPSGMRALSPTVPVSVISEGTFPRIGRIEYIYPRDFLLLKFPDY
jgi:hypothetical protein